MLLACPTWRLAQKCPERTTLKSPFPGLKGLLIAKSVTSFPPRVGLESARRRKRSIDALSIEPPGKAFWVKGQSLTSCPTRMETGKKRPNLPKLVKTCPNTSKLIQNCANLSKLIKTCPKGVKGYSLT